MDRAKRLRQEYWDKAFVGKTIVSVDVEAANLVVFNFKDGTSVELEADTLNVGSIGVIPLILTPEERQNEVQQSIT